MNAMIVKNNDAIGADANRSLGRMISSRIRELVTSGSRNGFLQADADDLRQDLTMEVVTRLAGFDPAKGSIEAFLAVVLDHKSASLLAHRRAARRNPGRCTRSLDERVINNEGKVVPLWQMLPIETGKRHLDGRV